MHKPELTFKKAVIGFSIPLLTLLIMVLNGIDVLIALIFAIIAVSIYGLAMGFKWDGIQNAAIKGGGNVFSAVLIMMLVGVIIGVWMSSGSVPAMLYYGLKLINPMFFLPTAFIICAITSIATGTCWGTAGTMGVALMGVAAGMGIPLPLTAGVIISGSHVGDKLSPLSDTTLLASASTGTNLFDHITSMLYTTVPASIICLVIYTIVGFRYGKASIDPQSINILTNGIYDNFNINILMLIPPLLVIVLSFKRVPAIPVFGIGVVFSIIWALIFQDTTLKEVLDVALNGYISNTGIESLDGLLSRGGALSMASTIYVSIMAGMFAGILDYLTILSTIMSRVKKVIKDAKGLVITVATTCFALMLGGGGQYATLTLPGVAFGEAFDELDVHSAVLSRTMEDVGTLIGSIIPWDVSAVFLSGALGVATLDYMPYALLPILSPIIAIVNALLGIGMFKKDDKIKFSLKRNKHKKESGSKT